MLSLEGLQKHLQQQTDARAIALVRIAMGLVGFLFALFTFRDLQLLAGPSMMRFPIVEGLPQLSPGFLLLFAFVSGVAALLFTVGLYTRLAGLVLFASVVYRHLGDWSLYQNYTALLGLFVLNLLWGNAGTAYSIDSWRKKLPQTLVPVWPQTLIRFQISVVYFYTALSKCNVDFLHGHVFQVTFAPRFGADLPWAWHAMAVGTIVFEFAIAFALWIPSTRAWFIALGTAFHLGIPLTMGIYAAFLGFSAEFISSYLLFVDYSPGSHRISFNASSRRATFWQAVGRRLDWLGVLVWEPNSSASGLVCQTGGKEYAGFAALRQILAFLPLGMPLAPCLGLWPISVIGHRIYGKFA